MTPHDDYVKKLEQVAKLTADEAKKLLLEEVQKDLTGEIAKKIRSAEERIKLEAHEKAKEILADAMKHAATEYVAEYTVSSITVPNALPLRSNGMESEMMVCTNEPKIPPKAPAKALAINKE